MNAAVPMSQVKAGGRPPLDDEVLAVQNRALLRILGEGDGFTLSALAAKAGRDPSNLKKTLTSLTERGLVTDDLLLTDAGANWCRKLDAFEGVTSSAPDLLRGRAGPDRFRANPHNPRKVIDGEELQGLAETMLDKGGVMQPLKVSPPDKAGVMTIAIGERRWRAAQLNAAAGHPETAWTLDFVIDPDFDPADAAMAAEYALIENGQRAGLSEIEQGRAALTIMEKLGIDAKAVAHRIGKATEGGIRTVQNQIRVIREADPADIAKFEAGGVDEEGKWTWRRLLATVQADRPATSAQPAEPKRPANAHLGLFLVEAALISDDTHGYWDGSIQLESRLQWPVGWEDGWFTYDATSGDFSLSVAAINWLTDADLGDDPELAFNRFRLAAGYPAVARPGPPWMSGALAGFNPSPSPAPVHRPISSPPAAFAPRAAASPAAAPPQALRGLKPTEMLAFLEILAARQDDGWVELDGRPGRFVPVHSDWTESSAIALQQELGLITILAQPQGRFAALTAKGETYAAEHAPPETIAEKVLALRHVQNLPTPPDGAWSTAWLNVPPAEDADPTAGAEAVQKAAELAGGALGILEALMENPPVSEAEARCRAARIRELLVEAGLHGPFVVSDDPSETGCLFDEKNNAVVAVVDVDRTLPEDIAAARTALLGAALNLALSLAGEKADA